MKTMQQIHDHDANRWIAISATIAAKTIKQYTEPMLVHGPV
jgi:hypothetical protein